jgi:delta8-fatty-acid desaturase
MACYRIGRIEGPWTNFTPPIRGGHFRELAKPDLSIKALLEEESEGKGRAAESGALRDDSSTNGDSDLCFDIPPPYSPVPPIKGRDEFIQDAMQREIDDSVRDYPSLDPKTQGAITAKYEALHRRIIGEGFYKHRYDAYLKESVRYAVLFGLFLFSMKSGYYLTSACFLGFWWQQIMFTAHDAGHCGITGSFVPDTLVGIFIADFCCGLSIGW